MPSMPRFESILFQVHRCLDIQFESKKKSALLGVEKPFQTKQKHFFHLLSNIVEQLGLEPGSQVTDDLFKNIEQWSSFNERIRNLIYTEQAEFRQIIWYLAGYLYMPSLGKQLAYWQIEEPLNKGMPHGQLWYLPNVYDGELKLPVTQVIDWLEDLIGDPWEKISPNLGGGMDKEARGTTSGVQSDSQLRTINGWRSKNSEPKSSTINKYFSDETQLDFKGALRLDPNLDLDSKFEIVLAFIKQKGLNSKSLSYQIGRHPIVETIINSHPSGLDKSEKETFIELMSNRYARPSMETIRKRLLVARAVQEGYKYLFKVFLDDSVDIYCPNPKRNRALELLEILKFTYRLSIEAHHKYPKNWRDQDRYFDDSIPGIYRDDLFISVMMTSSNDCTENLVGHLNRIFQDLKAGEELETLFHSDEKSLLEMEDLKRDRYSKWGEEVRELNTAKERIHSKSPWRVLQNMEHYRSVSMLLQDSSLRHKVHWQAAQRLRELAKTPEQKIRAIHSQLSLILHNEGRKHQTKESFSQVERLLAEAQNLGSESLYRAPWLNYKARHLLSCNCFDDARIVFKEALEACGDQSYGQLQGEIARDGLALEVGLPREKFSLKNYEYYYSNMLLNDVFEEGIDQNTQLEDVAAELSEYFWNDFYKPYPGQSRVNPLSLIKVDKILEGLQLLRESRDDEFSAYLKRYKPDLGKKRSKELRGDTALMFWIKFLHGEEKKLSHPMVKKKPDFQAEVSVVCEHIRELVTHIIDSWPTLVEMYDYKRQTPLMLAVDNKQEVLRDRLLDAGADVALQDYKGRTALHAAVATGSLDSLERLLSARGGDRAAVLGDITGCTILHTAIKLGNVDAAIFILRKKPELAEIKDKYYKTPRDFARELAKGQDFYRNMVNMLRNENRLPGSLSDYRALPKLFGN